jgi:peptidoglycan/xylan/chitin deacetylase (PgdA/CDA1 family)
LIVAPRALELALRASARPVGLALVYHSIAERNGDPTRELVAPHSATLVEEQLRYLRSSYRVVRPERIAEAASERRRGGRFPVAVTFDDDLASHRALALPILERAGVPATFFLCGASLERPFAFWWERLQEAVEKGLEVGESIHEVAARVEAMSPDERDAYAAGLEKRLKSAPGPGLTAGDVRGLRAAGHRIGFHTLRHDPLTELDDDALRAALQTGRAELEAIVGPLEAISYPHGKADARVADAARVAGFVRGFTGSYEAIVPDAEPLLLGRIEPTRGPIGRFALQLARALAGPHR